MPLNFMNAAVAFAAVVPVVVDAVDVVELAPS